MKKQFRIVFGKNIRTSDSIYGSTCLVHKKGKSILINEETFNELKEGKSVYESRTAGHGISTGCSYTKDNISEVYEIVENQINF
jgi:hypothetical protein